MAGEVAILYSPGAGGKAAGYQRTVGGNAVDAPIVIEGESYLPSYCALGGNVSLATANDHVLQLMAGSSLNVRIRRIYITQATSATTAGTATLEVWRLTSAGTGGTSVTAAAFDTGDSPAGATARALPSAKGTESTLLLRPVLLVRDSIPSTGGTNTSWEWTPTRNMKPIVIPAGTSNGIAIKNLNARTPATVNVWIEFTETLWL